MEQDQEQVDRVGKSKYKRLVDLYVIGKVHVLRDGTPLWLQVLNPFEREVVRREAQIAQARQVLAMKEHGSDEQNAHQGRLLRRGTQQRDRPASSTASCPRASTRSSRPSATTRTGPSVWPSSTGAKTTPTS
jgi:hypothetical protein